MKDTDGLATKPPSSLYESALNYVNAGFKVFPLVPNSKIPATENGFLGATDDPEVVKQLWSENPDYNIGLPMALNGLVAIDIDRHNSNGFINLENYILTNDLPDLPLTVENNSPNNGKHLIYKAPEGFTPKGILTSNVEIKYNGYIVVAPSIIRLRDSEETGEYEWTSEQGLLDEKPAELPAQWQKTLSAKYSKSVIPGESNSEEYSNFNYSAEKVREQCSFIAHCVENAHNLTYPYWLTMIQTCCRSVEGATLIHNWSQDYPDYEPDKTDLKIREGLKLKPATCDYISAGLCFHGCTGCKHRGLINSPVKLGKITSIFTTELLKEMNINKEELSFPLDVFPEKIERFVRNASFVKDAPPEYIAASILASTSCLINSQVFLQIKDDWRVPSVLWMAIVGETGDKKSPCYKEPKEVIDEMDDELKLVYEGELKNYSAALQFHKKMMKEWEKSTDTKSPPPEEPSFPIRQTIYVTQTSINALLAAQANNKHGVSVITDELAGFISAFNKFDNGSDERAYYLSSWSGDRYNANRKTQNKFVSEITTIYPFHNILGTIQYSEASKHIIKNEVTDGFAQRWLYVLTDYKIRADMTDDNIDSSLKDNLKYTLKSIYGELKDKDTPVYLELEPEAYQELKGFINLLDREIINKNNPKILRAYLVKMKDNTARICIPLHLLNGKGCNDRVSIDTVKKAIAVGKYFITSFLRMADKTAVIKEQAKEIYVLDWMKLKGYKEITASDLYLSNKSRFKSIDETTNILATLELMGAGKVVQSSNGRTKFVLAQND